jgi:hypothetical protein
VTIEQVEDASTGYRARLRVERRTDPLRRDGHTAPVIAEVEGAEPQQAIAELQAIAASNVSVAQRILRWQMRNRKKS